jgi:hypothetical protein
MTGRCPSAGVAGGMAALWHAQATPRDMAFPSACHRGPSRGLHPGAPLPLLYPSLCRMSSPSHRRAAPHPAVLRAALAGMLRGAPEVRRRGHTVRHGLQSVPLACLGRLIWLLNGSSASRRFRCMHRSLWRVRTVGNKK